MSARLSKVCSASNYMTKSGDSCARRLKMGTPGVYIWVSSLGYALPSEKSAPLLLGVAYPKENKSAKDTMVERRETTTGI
jgi:hypothetical protein